MEATSKTVYPKSTLYTREFIIDLPSGNIEVKALTFKELDTLNVKYSNRPNSLTVNTVKASLLNKDDFDKLSMEDINAIFKVIVQTSSLTIEEYDLVVDSISIIKEDSFRDATFKSCKLCQEKGLDTLRNCPMLDKEKHSPDVYYLLNNKKLTECPMDKINNSELVSDALKAFTMYKNKILPMSGGFLDQTEYYYRIAPVVFNMLNSPSLEDMK